MFQIEDTPSYTHKRTLNRIPTNTPIMADSILGSLYSHDTNKFIQRVIQMMSFGNEVRLYKWGRRIMANRGTDPAKELLHAIISADLPRVLADLTNPDSPLIDYIFYEIGIRRRSRDHLPWLTDEYADWMDSINYYCDTERNRFLPISTALVHLTDYLRGDLDAIKPLVYAIVNRIWRNAEESECYSRLAQATFVLHTYLFHFMGWSPDRHDTGIGARHDMRMHLAGRDLTMATVYDWDNFIMDSTCGLEAFPVLPRVSQALLATKGARVHRRCSFPFNHYDIVFADYGDDGVAMLVKHGEREIAYFLGWNDGYDNSIHRLFEENATDSPQSAKEDAEFYGWRHEMCDA